MSTHKEGTEYDIIFAGGGTAACIAAGRLAKADPNLSILIVERGKNNLNDPNVVNASRYLYHLAPNSETSIAYKGNKTADLNGREPIVTTGGLLGGGSSINFAMYTRASGVDYDSWNTEGWDAKSLLHYANKLETYHLDHPSVDKGVSSKRSLSDVAITRTGKTILRTEGGRSSLGGHTATVFGATGQLGRYIVNRLARQGCTVVVPFREEMTKRHLKVTGDLGRVIFVEYDLRNTASIEASVRHSDVVYNLVGRDYPTKNFTLEDVHVEGTERIAEAVAKYDVDRYIHVSSHNADVNSPSEFFATKGRGEIVARNIFPEATIVRPAPIFGFEDNLLLKLASVLNLFTANNMQEKFWPVHSIDVGAALEKMLYDDSTAGKTFELYGPKQYSLAEVAALVDKEIFKKRRHINVPKAILKPTAKVLNDVLWWHTISADEVEREFIDQVIDPEASTFRDLGIEPGDIANFTYHYLQGFRSSNYYDLPPATEKEKREDKKYIHVLDEL